MRVHVGPIKGTKGSSLDLDFRERMPSPWGADGTPAEPVDVHVRVTNSGKCYLVRGALSVKAEFACDRCLEPFSRLITDDVDEEFYPVEKAFDRTHGVDPGEERERFDEDETNTFTGDIIELGDVVREHLLLALPRKALCEEDCKGICSQCGQNLNSRSCNCPDQARDPRLAALGDLLERED